MGFLEILAMTACIVLTCLTMLWLSSLADRNSSIVDVFWGWGFIIANALYFVLAPEGFVQRKWLMSILVTVWGLRLALYIFWRNHGKGEDYRYRKFRAEAGASWWWK